MKAGRWVITLAIILVALNLLDILTTKIALSVGSEESNGFAIAMFTTLGFTIGLLVKLGAGAMFGCLTVYSYHLDCRTLRVCLTIGLICIVCLYVAVVCNNVICILQ